ncbi:MAG: hypothetical protein WC184_07055 [Acidimicrobiia bacterium]
MRSWRLLAETVAINNVLIDASYADVFVVERVIGEMPGPNDWEATIRTPDRTRLRAGRYTLTVNTPDGHLLEGWALLRFSDGHQHLFRGDGELEGVAATLTEP